MARPVVTCGRRVPYLMHGRTLYFTCDLPHGHDQHETPCTGRAYNYGAPTL
jgi:hypothetical protein